jgi:hypothetical protein
LEDTVPNNNRRVDTAAVDMHLREGTFNRRAGMGNLHLSKDRVDMAAPHLAQEAINPKDTGELSHPDTRLGVEFYLTYPMVLLTSIALLTFLSLSLFLIYPPLL